MKKTFLQSKLLMVTALALLFSGCADLLKEGDASYEVANAYHKGPSPYTVKPVSGENVGFRLAKNLFVGQRGFDSMPKFDNPDPLGTAPGGPFDDGSRYNANYPAVPAFAKMPANDYFSVTGELELVGKGLTTDAGTVGGSETDHMYYLEVPVMVNYNHRLGGDHVLYGGLGLYAATGLFGNYSSSFQGQTTTGSLSFGSNGDYTRMDYGFCIDAGFTICKNFDVSLSYDFGLRNINGADADELYNRSFGLNIGYRFK